MLLAGIYEQTLIQSTIVATCERQGGSALTNRDTTTLQFRVEGMDCDDCVRHIERIARDATGTDDVRVSLGAQSLTIKARDGLSQDMLDDMQREASDTGYIILPETSSKRHSAHQDPAYRRALWIVVLLNAGYGVVEMAGGFLADSQALKADALDFLGDGVITLFGLIAIGWSLAWRARSALIQGIFLGVLGLGVIASTIFRLSDGYIPEASQMGAFAIVALIVNVAAALVLIPHRSGDANVRAVWLFSRNDALGNVAVVIAAGIVAVTNQAWPDLAVAFIIAALFLQSAWSITHNALRDLRNTAGM